MNEGMNEWDKEKRFLVVSLVCWFRKFAEGVSGDMSGAVSSSVFGVWSLEFGVWSLEFGVWSLELT
jgi:hypothetical protein